uniref:PIN domain-containing protein n=1 Tax=Cyanothece sp. (strain PCC 7425 / ATCC 29141) TaxID=395961 RepID=B8HZ90_CYAP4
MNASLRFCLDLNIWCAALLAERKGRQGTAAQTLVQMVRLGTCPLGPVQLVISWGMLNRLRLVLERDLGVIPETADLLIETIGGYAHLGPAGISPQLILGGTGVLALRDQEDAHVLEVAIAGRANLLITANFKDFLSKDTDVVVPEQHAIHNAPGHRFHIVHPYLTLDWLRSGTIPPLSA